MVDNSSEVKNDQRLFRERCVSAHSKTACIQGSLPNLWRPESYDSQRGKLIPSLAELYTAAAEIVRVSVPNNLDSSVLDLGAGTGLLAKSVRASIPLCQLVLIDHSPEMLNKARERFRKDSLVSYVISDFSSFEDTDKYDAVVSALAIHHLEDQDKKALFARIKNSLRHGGVFVNVEQVCAPRDDAEQLYDNMHAVHVQRAGTTNQEWMAARERMKYDKPASLYSQLKWLEEVGFHSVDCLYKNFRFATIVGWI